MRIIRSLSLSFPRENATCLISDTAYQDLFPQWQAEVEICGKAEVILLSLGNGVPVPVGLVGRRLRECGQCGLTQGVAVQCRCVVLAWDGVVRRFALSIQRAVSRERNLLASKNSPSLKTAIVSVLLVV